ncbi:hypothetical protein D3C86_1732550 [compost metagenome]
MNSIGSSFLDIDGRTPMCTVPAGTPEDSLTKVSRRSACASNKRISGSTSRPKSDTTKPRPVRTNN